MLQLKSCRSCRSVRRREGTLLSDLQILLGLETTGQHASWLVHMLLNEMVREEADNERHHDHEGHKSKRLHVPNLQEKYVQYCEESNSTSLNETPPPRYIPCNIARDVVLALAFVCKWPLDWIVDCNRQWSTSSAASPCEQPIQERLPSTPTQHPS